MEGRRKSPVLHLCLLLLLAVSVQGKESVLYPYGPEAGDEHVQNIGPQDTEITLPVPMKFYGQSFNKAYIVKDGMVSLEPYTHFVKLQWREGTPNPGIDRPFFAPFHHNGYLPILNPQDYPGKIYYKLLSRARNDVSLTEDDRKLMLQLDDYLDQASVVLKSGFSSSFVLKVTWENVSSADDCDDDKLTTTGCPSSTFQVIIAANTNYTFAIFNYFNMEIPFTEHQLAGVNGGHGRGWTDVVPCTSFCVKRSKGNSARIASLVSRVGSDVAGRYILVVNDDVIVRGGCLSGGLKVAGLEVCPRQAGMFGGEMLSVSGLCSTPGTKIYCRFAANDLARTEGVMETTMRGRCPVPILTTRGQVLLELSTDNMSWKTSTYITIIHPGRMPSLEDLSDLQHSWFQIDPEELRLRWRKELFSSNVAAKLQLNLIGYREDRHGDSPVIMKHLEQLASDVLNSEEQYTVNPDRFQCSGQDCQDFEIALLQLQVTRDYVDDTTKYQAINMGPVTLGWYVKQAMTEQHGSRWPEEKCRLWSERDRHESDWLQHLLPCPCTLSQALADWGRWQPDMGCNMFRGSVCTYHIGAKHCVRSVHPSPDSAGNQCCYEEDGSLRYAADTFQGSTPDRSHDWGATPFGRPDQVPSLSHWLHDVVTFYYCCLWLEYGHCDVYMDRRPTRDCKQYRPPHAATVYGDQHITTFDGRSYYFGGSGDFWLLKSNLLNVQGRFEERKNEYLDINEQTQLAPTNLTSLVMWTPDSDVITINLAPLGGPRNRKLDVRVGWQRRFFEESSMMWQDFNGVSIVNNADSALTQEDRQHSNFTVLFVTGAAVQVAERQGLFHAIVILPPESGEMRKEMMVDRFAGVRARARVRTAGLFGTLDGNAFNDFRNPSGEIIPAEAQDDKVYLDFAFRWLVADNESQFHWHRKTVDKRSPLFGDAKDFRYKSEFAAMRPSDHQVQWVCGDSSVCRHDYYVSANDKVAHASHKAELAFQALTHSQTVVRTCGLLDIPNAQKSSTVYREGSVVKVTGCRPDGSPVQGSGPQVYTCNASQLSAEPLWTPTPDRDLCPQTAWEEEPEQASDVGMIVGIVVGVVVVIVLVVVVVVIVIFGRRRREASLGDESGDRPVPAKRSHAASDVVVEAGADKVLLKGKGRDGGVVKMSEMITEMKDRRGSQEEV